MSTDCKNCATLYQGNFCPQCGQKASTGRLTVRHVLEEGWHGVTHTDKRFLFLLGALIGQPGRVINEYIAGRRKKYFSPYMFYVVITGLLIFVTLKVFAREDALYHRYDEFDRFAFGSANFVELLVQFFYWLFTSLHFDGQAYTSLIDYVVLAYVLARVIAPMKWWNWPWEAVQYSF